MKRELESKIAYLQPSWVPVTAYFGGGTPSVVSGDFVREMISLLGFYLHSFHQSVREITVEANPESLDAAKVESWRKAGVNRVHLGVQTLNPRLLEYLGRRGSPESAQTALSLLRDSGLHNYGADLIYGIYSQTRRDLDAILDLFFAYNVRHISAYVLTLHEGTRLYTDIQRGIKKAASPHRDYFHDRYLEKKLADVGFQRYEISNYAKPGFASLHNILYWKYRPYIGLGAGAHSFLPPFRFAGKKNNRRHPETETDFFSRENEDPRNMHIGLYRYLNYQSFSAFRSLTPAQRNAIAVKMKSLEARGMLELFPHGFRVTPSGAMFNDPLLAEMMD